MTENLRRFRDLLLVLYPSQPSKGAALTKTIASATARTMPESQETARPFANGLRWLMNTSGPDRGFEFGGHIGSNGWAWRPTQKNKNLFSLPIRMRLFASLAFLASARQPVSLCDGKAEA
jgi:hypothetical protein